MANKSWCNFDNNILCSGIVTGSGLYESIALPSARGFSIQITPTSGTATVYNSNDGTNWVAWDDGTISSTALGSFDPCRYVKVANGTATTCSYAIWGWL